MSDERTSEPPDYAALAKRFLDLWQEQMTALAGDPELAAGMSRFLAVLPQGFPFWTGSQNGARPRKNRAASAAASSDGGGQPLDRIAARLDAIEERLARMESSARRTRATARGKPKKRSR
jgi:hypothetical protein